MSAGIVVVGVLALGNLLLTVLLARRVRQLGAKVAESSRSPWLAPGTDVPAFETVTVGGDRVSLDELRGQRTLVGFFSTGCAPCRQQLPLFAEHAVADDSPARVLAVIVGNSAEADEFAALLDGKAMVVRERLGGPAARAFSAHAFPGIYLLDPRGKVTASGPSVAALAASRTGGPATHR